MSHLPAVDVPMLIQVGEMPDRDMSKAQTSHLKG
jgi:hypothetical protein